MSIETPLAKELACFQKSNDRFLALAGENDDFDPALLNVKYRIRSLSLSEDDLIFSVSGYRFPRPDHGEKLLRIKRVFAWRRCHVVPSRLNALRAPIISRHRPE